MSLILWTCKRLLALILVQPTKIIIEIISITLLNPKFLAYNVYLQLKLILHACAALLSLLCTELFAYSSKYLLLFPAINLLHNCKINRKSKVLREAVIPQLLQESK